MKPLTFSSPIKLVLAAARAFGLKGALQILDGQDRRIIRKQLAHTKVDYFNANLVWDKVQELLEPMSVLFTADN